MSLNGLAHGASLPLFMMLQKIEGKTTLEAVADINNGILALQLEDHIEIVILLDGNTIRLNIEPISDFGLLVVKELKSRTTLPPCPAGTCDFNSQGECKWCKSPLRI